ncbi:MAG: peptidylprolyl isomerase [Patescibacteria group bacterium]
MDKRATIILVSTVVIILLLTGIVGFSLSKNKTSPPKQLTDVNITEEKTTMNNKQNSIPEMQIDENKSYQAIIETDLGTMTVDLDSKQTPITANNFVSLARKSFYDNTIFHRIIAGFMIQGGDPQGNGTGGPGYQFDDEPFTGEYTRGTVAMANSGPNTNGSQFFIMHQDYPLPKNYVIFGKISSGLETLDKIAQAEVETGATGESSKPVTPVTIRTITIVEK